MRYELNRWLEVNASGFYICKHNVVKTIGEIPVEGGGSTVNKSVQAQIGRAVSKGFDLELTLRPLTNLQIGGGWGWSDYRVIVRWVIGTLR